MSKINLMQVPVCRMNDTRLSSDASRTACLDVLELTGLFMNLRVISSASGGKVAEKTPTCKFGGSNWKIS